MTWLYWGIPLMVVGLAVALVPLLMGMKRHEKMLDDEERSVAHNRRVLGHRPASRI